MHEADRVECKQNSGTCVRPIKSQNTSPTNLYSATLWCRVILSIDTNVSEQLFASFFRVEVCRIYL
jgi:hypothetical protein